MFLILKDVFNSKSRKLSLSRITYT